MSAKNPNIQHRIRTRYGLSVLQVLNKLETANPNNRPQETVSIDRNAGYALGSCTFARYDKDPEKGLDRMIFYTNMHVGANANELWITHPMWGNARVSVLAYGGSRRNDIAGLVLHNASKLVPEDWLNAVKPVDVPLKSTKRKNLVDMECYIVGYPLGQRNLTITSGRVSSNQDLGGRAWIQTDGAMNHGNSGGMFMVYDPVTDKLDYVGIPSMGIPGAQNMAYAIPVAEVRSVANSLANYKGESGTRLDPARASTAPFLSLEEPFLGVRFGPFVPHLAGYPVIGIESDSPFAGKGNGRLQIDDSLFKIGDAVANKESGLFYVKEMQFAYGLPTMFGGAPMGETLTVTVRRLTEQTALVASELVHGHANTPLWMHALIGNPLLAKTENPIFEEVIVSAPWVADINLGVRERFIGLEPLDFESLAGIVVTQLSAQHFQDPTRYPQMIPVLMQFSKHENRVKPVLFVVDIVQGDSIAKRAGIPAGAILVNVNGVSVSTVDDYRKALLLTKPSVNDGNLSFIFMGRNGPINLTIDPRVALQNTEMLSSATNQRVTKAARELESKEMREQFRENEKMPKDTSKKTRKKDVFSMFLDKSSSGSGSGTEPESESESESGSGSGSDSSSSSSSDESGGIAPPINPMQGGYPIQPVPRYTPVNNCAEATCEQIALDYSYVCDMSGGVFCSVECKSMNVL